MSAVGGGIVRELAEDEALGDGEALQNGETHKTDDALRDDEARQRTSRSTSRGRSNNALLGAPKFDADIAWSPPSSVFWRFRGGDSRSSDGDSGSSGVWPSSTAATVMSLSVRFGVIRAGEASRLWQTSRLGEQLMAGWRVRCRWS